MVGRTSAMAAPANPPLDTVNQNIPRTPSKSIPSRQIAPMGMKIEPINPPPLPTNLLNVMSPVNQNGSFEFDRVIKAAQVMRRTRKTKAWKHVYIVLRPNLLSIYNDKNETKLRHQINLSEVTAVARQKDPKRKMDHVFGVFSPSRNYHFCAGSEKEAFEWVELIRREARIDEEEEEMILMSPGGQTQNTFTGFDRIASKRETVVSSSSEAEARPTSAVSRENVRNVRRLSHTAAYSGNEQGSFSDFSDTPVPGTFQDSSVSLPSNRVNGALALRNFSQVSNIGAMPDDERVIYHGWLYVLKSKGGVRQWKKLWVVLRPKTLGLYKNEDEYRANLILPFLNIINAVEIDPISRSKRCCMQIISDERNYRFCAPDEDALAKWLGAFKSLLAKRKEAELQRAGAAASNPALATAPALQPSPLPR